MSLLFVLSLFFFVFFPNTILDGKVNIVLFIIFSIVSFIISFLSVERNYKFVIVSIFLVLISVVIAKFSLYSEVEIYRVSDSVRILFYLLVTFTLLVIKRFDSIKGASLMFFILEATIVVLQILDVSLTSNIYDVSKVGVTTAGYTQFRYTGTLSNPNVLGVFFVYLIALNISWKNRFFCYFLFLALTFVSGSRTGFIMALSSILIYEIRFDFCYKRLIKMSTFFFLSLCVFGGWLYFYANDFYYFAQISVVARDLLNGEGLQSFHQVSSLMTRISLWSELVFAWSEGGLKVWLLGLPDIERYRYADSSYVFILTKYGLLMGGALLYSLYIIHRKYFQMFYNNEVKCKLIFWTSFCVLSAIFSDILVSYYYWVMLATFPFMVKHSEKA